MSTLHNLRTSGNRLKSVICLTLALSPVLLTATAPGTATAQSAYPGSNIVCSRQFAYVANEDGNNVSGYIIDRASGKLSPIEGSPFTTGKSGPTSVVVDPAGRFLYVTNQHASDNVVAGFSIDCDTGKLTPIPGSPFAAGSGPSSIAIDPSGKFSYVANFGSNNISAFRIDDNSGRLMPVAGSPFPAGSSPSSVTVDPLGKFVYVTNQSSDNVSGYTIDSVTGALTAVTGSPFAAGSSPVSVTVDPNDRFVYVANQSSDNISGYSIDPTTGALTPLGTSPFGPVAGGFTSVTVGPTGGFVYLAGSGGVSIYTINQTVPISAVAVFPPRTYTDSSRRLQARLLVEVQRASWLWTIPAPFSMRRINLRMTFPPIPSAPVSNPLRGHPSPQVLVLSLLPWCVRAPFHFTRRRKSQIRRASDSSSPSPQRRSTTKARSPAPKPLWREASSSCQLSSTLGERRR
jgi:6-phosphogluconolactonase (cycloisomerase 2 family)